ncbi:MAG: thioredoxin [Saprospiraceae bacterium]|nr:thioredoxin [Saprospiraceae bacterium]
MKEIRNVEDLRRITEGGKPVLLDFYADWCGPCRMLTPTLEELSEKLGNDAVVAKVNVDENRALATEFQVRSIPALFFLKEGKVIDRLQGLQSLTTLEQKLRPLLEVTVVP